MKTNPTEILENISYWTVNDPNGKVKKLYGQMTGEISLWIQAYANIYSNRGSMTKGVIDDTVDGTSIEGIRKIMKALKTQRYYPKPVKRIYIEKKSGNKKRPLGLPTFTDKLIQEVMRMQLSAVYEPIFKDCSHGFRPNRSCHTALNYIRRTFTGTKWFVEGDIRGCFDNIKHEILINLLSKKIDDKRYIELIRKFLKAGYIEDWTYYNTFSGTPQGGILSPLLANVYLHELDKHVIGLSLSLETKKRRDRNKKYCRIRRQISYRREKLKEARANRDTNQIQELSKEIKERRKELQRMPSYDTYDPEYKRVRYCRYADDFIIGVIGSKKDAEAVKRKVGKFLDETLSLEMSDRKTLITHNSDRVRFLNYEIKIGQPRDGRQIDNRRSTVGRPMLLMPKDVRENQCSEFTKNGKITHLPDLINLSDVEILLSYDRKVRGWYNYWKMAINILEMREVYWKAEGSFLKTMANKYNTSLMKMKQKYYDKERKQIVVRLKTDNGIKKYRLINSFQRDKRPIKDWKIDSKLNIYYFPDGVEIKRRIQTNECELCGRKTDKIVAHHVRKMADIRRSKIKREWKKVMIAKNRKSLMVCKTCHNRIHRND